MSGQALARRLHASWKMQRGHAWDGMTGSHWDGAGDAMAGQKCPAIFVRKTCVLPSWCYCRFKVMLSA